MTTDEYNGNDDNIQNDYDTHGGSFKGVYRGKGAEGEREADYNPGPADKLELNGNEGGFDTLSYQDSR